MTGIFKQKTPANIILLFILGVFIKLPVFFHSQGYILKESDAFLFRGMVAGIKYTGAGAFVFSMVGFILNMVIAATINHFININRLMSKSNFLAGMAYVLITSFLPSFNLLSSNLIASCLLVTSFALLYKSYNIKTEKNNIFNAAFLIGIASLFFLPAILFAIWAFIALALLRPFRLSEWIILLLGITTPYYFYSAYLFLNDQFHIPNYFFHISFLSSKIKYTIWHAIAFFLLLAPLLAGIYYMQAGTNKMTVHARKGWYLFLWYIVISIVVALFDIDTTSENVVIILVPIAAFHGYGYLNAELKPYPKIAFWLTVAYIVTAEFYSPLWN